MRSKHSNSTSEIVRDALRLLEEQDRIKGLRLKLLREKVQKDRDELDKDVLGRTLHLVFGNYLMLAEQERK